MSRFVRWQMLHRISLSLTMDSIKVAPRYIYCLYLVANPVGARPLIIIGTHCMTDSTNIIIGFFLQNHDIAVDILTLRLRCGVL